LKIFGLKSMFALMAIIALSFSACGEESKKPAEAPAEEPAKVETKAPAVEVKTEAPAAKAEEPAAPAPAKEETASVDGAKIYTKCIGCHGVNAEKSALGASQVIAGWDVEKIESALKGYKDGTYGGNQAVIMKGQVAPLGDAEIKALAEYISSK
jgi:cytochrome c553